MLIVTSLAFSLFCSANLKAEILPTISIKTLKPTICPGYQTKMLVTVTGSNAVPNYEINGTAYTTDNLPSGFDWLENGLLYSDYGVNSDTDIEITVTPYLIWYSIEPQRYQVIQPKQPAMIKISQLACE